MNRRVEHFNLLHAASFKFRGILMVPLVAFAFLCGKWEWEYRPGILAIGLLLFAVGLGLRCWAQRHFKYRLRSGNEHHLAVTGPFAYCRNPVYIGNLLVLAGITTLCEIIWAIPLVLLWGGIVYSLAVRFEELRLTKRFGIEYLNYCAEVSRWLPKAPGPPAEASLTAVGLAGWPRVLLAEWQCLLLLLVPGLKEVVVDYLHTL